MAKSENNGALRRRRKAFVLVVACVAAAVAVLAVLYGRDALAYLADGRRVQEQAARLGPVAPIAFAALVVVQQLSAFIPAEPFELAAGYAFGFWEGALVYLAGSVFGTAAIIVVVRLVGDRVLRLLVSPGRLERFERLGDSPRFELLLLVYFLVPVAPKDVMTYAAALAGVKPLRILLITTAGRLPSIAASALASSLAAGGDWRAAAFVAGGIAAFVLVGAAVYYRMRRREEARRDADGHSGAGRGDG